MSKAYRFTSVCAACIAKGETDSCPHRVHRLPHWLSVRKQKLVEFMMSGNQADLDREIKGIAAVDDSTVFSRMKIDEFFSRPRFSASEYVDTVYVSIDPNSGQWDSRSTGGSDFAMVSFYEAAGQTIVCGAEAVDAFGVDDFLPHIYEHLRRIRASPVTGLSRIVIAAEMNLGHEASHIEKFCRDRFTNLEFLQETELKVGVPTTNALKREMAFELRDRLQHGVMRLSDEFISSSTTEKNDVLGKLKQQMFDYAEVRTPSTDPLKAPTIQYSGKKGGKRDDLAVALQLALVWSKVAKASPKYGIRV